MRGPKPPAITLTNDERQNLELLIRRHSTPQHLALRARIILAAACGFNNAQIARQQAVNVDTVRHWRTRWLLVQSISLTELSVEERLADAPRGGKPPPSPTNKSVGLSPWPAKHPVARAARSASGRARKSPTKSSNAGL